MTKRREFLKKTGAATAGAVAGAAVSAPYVHAQKPIKWRLQTYAGAALAEHVVKPAIDSFNKIANGQMVIELYTADQLVPTGELFRAMQAGHHRRRPERRGLHGGAPVDVGRVRRILPVLDLALQPRCARIVQPVWSERDLGRGLRRGGERHLAQRRLLGPLPLQHGEADSQPRRSQGPAGLYTFPSAGRFLSRFGVVPVSNLPYEDAEVAVQTGELDGMAWSGITEDYTVGWADVTNYFLTNNISGAWIGSFLANTEKLERGARASPGPCSSCAWTAPTTTGSTGTGAARRSFAPRARSWSSPPSPTEEWKRRSRPKCLQVLGRDRVQERQRAAKRGRRSSAKYNETMAKAGRPYRYR